MFGPAVGFGPIPDGHDIPDMPLVSFQQGRYHKELKSLIVGTMANEVSDMAVLVPPLQFSPCAAILKGLNLSYRRPCAD